MQIDETMIFKGYSFGTAALLVAAAGGLLAVLWAIQIGRSRAWVRAGSVGLRMGAVALIAFALMEPVMRTREPVPGRNFLFHLFDDSGSMGIRDYDHDARASALARIASAGGEARGRLDQTYLSAEFAFDEQLRRREDWEATASQDKATDLGAVLHQVKLQTAGLPVAGVVLYTDGNSTVGAGMDEVVSAAVDLGLPIYAVGTAPAEAPADAWVDGVIHPAEIAGSIETSVTVLAGARGMTGQALSVTLFEDERELETRRVQPAADPQTLPVEFAVRPRNEGVTIYKAVVSAAAPDAYGWNDSKEFFINVTAKKRRVLYIEGAPRYEYRFLRAAFEDDARFEVTSAVYVTREGELYRQGVEGQEQLKSGFPATKDELFAYDVVVIGDVPSARISQEQTAWLRDFVRNRGGGLLLLGGEHSFRPKGFGATALAEVLPFDLEASRLNQARAESQVVPTRLGIERNLFGAFDGRSRAPAPWSGLPPLSGLYGLAGLKPGARALCVIEEGLGEANPPVVAYQRFGQGVCLVCGVSATWFWKFQLPSEDTRYQSFWKEMILVLMEGAQGRLGVKADPNVVAPGVSVRIYGAALDAAFAPDYSAAVRLTVKGPDGSVTELGARRSREAGVTFEHEFAPPVAGLYRITATSEIDGEQRSGESILLVREESPEFSAVNLNAALLREIAEATGGAYVHLSDYDQLAEKIRPGKGAVQRETERSMWDAPPMLAAILAMLLGEWLLRRAGGLA